MNTAQALFPLEDDVRRLMVDGHWRTRLEIWVRVKGRPNRLRRTIAQLAERGELESRDCEDPARGSVEYRLAGTKETID
ncbi:MAG: hypothetical protein ACLFV3_12150 [Phycisphaeraceae bacterium]